MSDRVPAVGAAQVEDVPWRVAPVVAAAAFMEVLDISIANVSLQHIAGDLAASQDESTWVLTSYLVTNAIVLPIAGWLASVVGRKRFFMMCIAGFTVSSLLCGMAPTLGTLILFRAIQGLTGGGLQPLAQAIMADTFPPRQRGMAFALYGMSVVFAPAIGPALGGWITDEASWRWVFLLNVPVGIVLVGLINAIVHEPESLIAARAEKLARGLRIDYLGFGLLSLGFGALQVVLDKGQELDWFASSFIFWLSVVSVVSLVAFVLWELDHDDPIVEVHLLFDRNFGVASLLMFVLGFMLLGSTVLLPVMVQTLLGYTATLAGLVLTPGGFLIMAVMPLIGRLAATVDARYLITAGLLLSAFALLLMTHFDTQVDFTTLLWARVYQALGLSLLFIPINTAAFQGIPIQKSAQAASIINVARNIGGSFGISIVVTELSRQAQNHQTVLAGHTTPLDHAYRTTLFALERMFAIAGDAPHAAQRAAAEIYRLLGQQATMQAFIDDYRLLAVIFVLLIPFVYLMRPATLQTRGDGPAAH